MTLNPMSLTGRTLMVTGASSGIGRETCVLLSQLGAKVVLVGRNREQLNATVGKLDGAPCRVEPFDLSQTTAINDWMKRVGNEEGGLHGFVHCAGMQLTRPLRVTTPENIDEVLRINFLAAVQLAKSFRQRGVCHKPSSIVFVSSIMGLIGLPALSIYSASKGALDGFCRSLALEYAPEEIRVNCVSPGHVRSEMTESVAHQMPLEQYEVLKAAHPLGFGSTLDVANAIAFLMAETGRWITGTTLVVDGGYTAK